MPLHKSRVAKPAQSQTCKRSLGVCIPGGTLRAKQARKSIGIRGPDRSNFPGNEDGLPVFKFTCPPLCSNLADVDSVGLMKVLCGKNIVVGVSGGIAAYKSVELVRLLIKSEAVVRVVMTKNAAEFVGPLTFEAISGQPASSDLFERKGDASIKHIEWAEEADVVVVAPATANVIAKHANGIADDALSTFLLAVTCHVVFCPSMNAHMYENMAVRRNLDTLRADGILVVEPGEGELACGTSGPGRLPEPPEIVDRIAYCLYPKDLYGKKVLVTAGPTQEPIDPVRFVSNPSSGKMGYAIAKAAAHRGADVVLVSGPTNLPGPANVKTVRVGTAAEMADAVFEHVKDSRVIIKSAAVSDYSPVSAATQKIKKEKDEMILEMKKNRDILRELGGIKEDRILVGFAAETENLDKNAAEKLNKKNLDMIVGNLVGRPDSGFGTDTNKVNLYHRDGTVESLPTIEKEDVAHIILDRVVRKFAGESPNA